MRRKFIVFFIVFFLLPIISVQSYVLSNSFYLEDKIYSNVKIEDEFVDDAVMVVFRGYIIDNTNLFNEISNILMILVY